MTELLLRGGLIIDGSGAPAYRSDVVVRGNQIVEISTGLPRSGRRVLEVEGLVVAPGFIDMHTHVDFTLPVYPHAAAMIRQGVTTLVAGNCGLSPFPAPPDKLELLKESSAFLDAGISWHWKDAAGYLSYLASLPLACNVALLVGHGAVRTAVLGFEPRAPTPAELAVMEGFVAEAFAAGTFGLSSGLTYAPGFYAGTDELVALARVAARFGGFYASHVRNESDRLLEAVTEALAIGAEAGVPVQLSHHKVLERSNWGLVERSLALVDAARGAGQDVLLDQYPYDASSTTLLTIVPRWTLDGGVAALQRRLRDVAVRTKISAELLDDRAGVNRTHYRFDPTNILLSAIPEGANRKYQGMRLAEVAAVTGRHAAEVALDLLLAEGGGVQTVTFGRVADDDIERVMRHPATMIASDGWTLDPAAGGTPHPRSYGTFVRVLGRYVREQGVLSIEEAVHKMTGLPARRLGRSDLGGVKVGSRADLVAFDPARVVDSASFVEPHRYPVGVEHVVVGGQLVVEEREQTGASPGLVLRPIRSGARPPRVAARRPAR